MTSNIEATPPVERPRVELVEPATLERYAVDWMLPPAGFVPAYEVAPDPALKP